MSSASALRDELRTLFLFEAFNDDQLDFLVERGEVLVFDADAVIYREQEPAEWFYVLLEGGVQMRRRVAGEEVVMRESTQRGVYAGAMRSFLPSGEDPNYGGGLTTTRPSRFFRLRGSDLAEFMQRNMPMALHLLDGLYVGLRTSEARIRQREMLVALGGLAARVTHELNNPAAAAMRASAQLRQRVATMRHKLAFLAEERIDPARLVRLVKIQEDAVERAAKAVRRPAIEESALEDALLEWLDARGVVNAWELAPVFAGASFDTAWLDEVAEAAESDELDGALHWLAGTLETESLLDEIEEATGRMATIVGAVKQRTQLDRAPDGNVDVHADLDATLTLLGSSLAGVSVERDYAEDLPAVPGFGGELSQVWTNLLDNAADALAGRGRLLVRTRHRDGPGVEGGAPLGGEVVVDVVDDGPGIPAELIGQIFEPFFTTKRPGEGTGVGLEIAKEVVERHGGRIEVTSRPGETCFRVRLPLEPASAAPA